ncbi:putative ABC transport system permease protein [Izhakiella capsodis]|uniref:Putative ABC transport system permease protein n=1 Tax=Izhakiella capsodis TaxID=1367852 RepID=A0A1I4XEH2_9GAMM|nr:ABC transporter permease [Izhakiella capsodis]SFN24062.1 putative ABC transport system permease protein [Izhakiella capsodis]
MSGQRVLATVLVVVILLFVVWCARYRSQDVKFAFLNLFRHRRRSFSTIAAIVLGGVSIFLYGGFIDYSFWILKEQTIRTNIGHVQIFNQNYFETTNKSKSQIDDYSGLKKAILSDPALAGSISTISGQLEFTGVISKYESDTSSYFSALGVEPLPALKLGSFDKIISGSDLSRVKTNEITLGSGLAKALDAHYGDWLDVLVVNTHGGQGALSLKLRGVFKSGIKDYDDVAMKIPLETAQRMMGTDGVSKVLILLKEDNTAIFSDRLRQFIANHHLPLIVKDWREVSLFYQQVEGLLSGVYFFIKLIVSLIVIFMIGNSMTMNVIERTREITTLRAIGLKPMHVTRLFLLEGIFVGMIGATGSLVVGYAIASVINLYGIAMPPSPGQSVGYTAFIKTNSFELNWITLVLPILTATVAAILPALRASRLNITDAFKFS